MPTLYTSLKPSVRVPRGETKLTEITPTVAQRFQSSELPEAPKKVNRRILIAGAGLGGLSAGYELSQRGYQVQVVDARGRLGGQRSSVQAVSVRAQPGFISVDSLS
jgi:heterodisulfide reductase subunit A-like polyferredoxin